MENRALVALTCFFCAAPHSPDEWIGTCDRCGRSLRVDYRLEGGAAFGDRAVVDSLWRYDALLPVRGGQAISLGEGWTELVEVSKRRWIKDEATNPTGSFKDRGMSVAVSTAKAMGVAGLAAPSAGNAAESLAAYAREAGLGVVVAMPRDTPVVFVDACLASGARVELVPGTISDAGAWLDEHLPSGYANVATLREPFRVEGKKTLAYELYEQRDGLLPDVIIFPTGGGTGIIGMWKAFSEMEHLGWLSSWRPRLVLVQSAGCAPIVRAFEAGESETAPWEDSTAGAHGLRVPDPFGGALCLRALEETRGIAVAIADDRLYETADALSAETGLDVCPEGGAAWAAFHELRGQGWIGPDDDVVVFNTGAGSKYR